MQRSDLGFHAADVAQTKDRLLALAGHAVCPFGTGPALGTGYHDSPMGTGCGLLPVLPVPKAQRRPARPVSGGRGGRVQRLRCDATFRRAAVTDEVVD